MLCSVYSLKFQSFSLYRFLQRQAKDVQISLFRNTRYIHLDRTSLITGSELWVIFKNESLFQQTSIKGKNLSNLNMKEHIHSHGHPHCIILIFQLIFQVELNNSTMMCLDGI